jgi:hypothetical protein
MKNDSQLLCTFVPEVELDNIIDLISDRCNLVFGKIYILENLNDLNQFIFTYNVVKDNTLDISIIPSTISVHRKKQTNTIYTINAINKLIESKNNGVLDKTFRIDWEELRNTVLVTAYNKLKVIPTALSEIVDI